METITVTVKEVYEALEDNGLELLRDEWVVTDYNGNITAACVLGQTAINLGAVATYEEANFPIEYEANRIDQPGSLFFELNKLPPKFGKWFPEDEKISRGAASQIIYWNDKWIVDDGETDDYNDGYEGHWALPTYEEVAAMAYDILSPHFDKEITLIKQEWTLA